DGVGAGLVQPLPRAGVALELLEAGAPHEHARLDGAERRDPPRRVWCPDRVAGEHLVGAPGDAPEQTHGVRHVHGLAEDVAVHHDGRVGGQHTSNVTLALHRQLPPHRLELGGRHALHVANRALPFPARLVHVGGTNAEGDAEPAQDVEASRRLRTEHERSMGADHGARIPQAAAAEALWLGAAAVSAQRRLAMLLRRLSALLLGSLSLTGLLGVGEARAQECSSALSTCFDANALDLPVAATPFAAVGDASAQLAPGRLSFGLGFSYLREPVVVTAPSPDPEGRRVPLVSDLWQADLLIAVGLLEELHLGIGLPLRPAQEGGGADAATSRVGGTLRGSAVADPRVILGWRVLPRGPVVGRLQLKVKLPLGDEGAF